MFSHLSRTHKGELYLLAQSFLWSLFPVITILSFSGVTPIYSAAIGSFFSSAFFAIIVTYKKGWNQWGPHAPWKDIFIASFFIGFVFYTLYFTGLKYTTAGNASIVALLEVFFSFLILTVFLKHEPVVPVQVLGSACMMCGAAIILVPKASGWHFGDMLIVAGTMITPLANKHMQRARQKVTSDFILFVRGFFAGVCLLLLAYFTEPLPSIQAVRGSLFFLSINGLLLLGLSKFLWLESIHLLPITKAISLASISPFFTLIFAYVILHESVTWFQITALFPIMLGVYFLTRRKLEIHELE